MAGTDSTAPLPPRTGFAGFEDRIFDLMDYPPYRYGTLAALLLAAILIPLLTRGSELELRVRDAVSRRSCLCRHIALAV